MKIEEGLTHKHGSIVEIPDVGRSDLPAFLFRNSYLQGAEIGTYKGYYTDELLSAGLEVWGVDPYIAYDEYNMPGIDFQARQDYLCKRHLQRLKRHPKYHFIRKFSVDAAKDFEPNSLDFVYIDGHHGLKYIVEDLWEWTKIVRPGGIIAGHDYAITPKDARDPFVLHIKYGLRAFADAFNIRPIYVLGRYDEIPGETRDKWRSWMFINP